MPSRVLVALDNFRIQRRSLEIAAHLAVRQGWPLTVLFIESIELNYAAALPFVREVDRLSGALQPFEPAQLERQMERQLAQIESWLTEIRTQWSLSGAVEIERGRYVETALATAGTQDLLVFSERHHWLSITYRPPVWVWFDGSPSAQQALALGRELARDQGCRLSLAGTAAPPEDNRVSRNPEDFLELIERQGCTAVVCPRTSPLAGQLPLRANCPVILV